MPATRLTIAEVCRIEPAIARLLAEAKALRLRRESTWHDYGSFKRRGESLVGFNAAAEELQNAEAYEVYINALLLALDL